MWETRETYRDGKLVRLEAVTAESPEQPLLPGFPAGILAYSLNHHSVKTGSAVRSQDSVDGGGRGGPGQASTSASECL